MLVFDNKLWPSRQTYQTCGQSAWVGLVYQTNWFFFELYANFSCEKKSTTNTCYWKVNFLDRHSMYFVQVLIKWFLFSNNYCKIFSKDISQNCKFLRDCSAIKVEKIETIFVVLWLQEIFVHFGLFSYLKEIN